MKASRILRWTRKALLGAGLAGVFLWFGSNAVPFLWQNWDNWAFDRQVQGQPVNLSGYVSDKQRLITRSVAGWLGLVTTRESSYTSGSPPAPPTLLANNALIGRLTIPRLNLSTTVREGTGDDILLLAVGHIRGTALPGAEGNVAVAGHRDTLFSGLAGISIDDIIEFETVQGSYRYRVDSTEIVTSKDVSVLKAHTYSELTLVTCYPFDYIGPAPERFIVKARQVKARQTLSETAVQQERAPAPVRGTTNQAPQDKAAFFISRRHSQQLAPGISIGIDETDAAGEQVNGWLWIMPDRRTIWLRDQAAHEPLIFYQNGERRELLITGVTGDSATGYLRLHGETTYAQSIVSH